MWKKYWNNNNIEKRSYYDWEKATSTQTVPLIHPKLWSLRVASPSWLAGCKDCDAIDPRICCVSDHCDNAARSCHLLVIVLFQARMPFIPLMGENLKMIKEFTLGFPTRLHI